MSTETPHISFYYRNYKNVVSLYHVIEPWFEFCRTPQYTLDGFGPLGPQPEWVLHGKRADAEGNFTLQRTFKLSRIIGSIQSNLNVSDR